MTKHALSELASRGIELLQKKDPVLYNLLEQEHCRQTDVLAMVAASSLADPSVLVCESMSAANVTTEGYPGARYHAGCKYIDQIERLAIERAKVAFQAQYANVQPHSGTSANAIVMFSLLQPGDTILGMELNSGGHLTHGARASVIGQYFNAIGYGLNSKGLLDYDKIHSLALQHKPRLIISGASSYPRTIDFRRFREIADEVGAYLLADISHIAGLVVANEHSSPIDYAHFTTTSTYKQLYGPRGGLILIGAEIDCFAPDGKQTLPEMVQRAVFPFFQGTPNISAIAAKARALAMIITPDFKKLANLIVDDARMLAECLAGDGYHVLTGGTDNHMVLIDIFSSMGISGATAEKALEECNIIVNKNRIPGDRKPALVTSGMRLGTNSLALRGMGPDEMKKCATLIHRILSSIKVTGEFDFHLDTNLKESVKGEVIELCNRHPIPEYPGITHHDYSVSVLT